MNRQRLAAAATLFSTMCASFLARPVLAQPIAASPAPCTLVQSFTPDRVFAHDIADARTLAFIAYIETVSAAERDEIVSHAAAPLSKDVLAALQAPATTACDSTEIGFRTARIVYDLSATWHDAAPADAVEQAVHDAATALVLRERVSELTRDAALAVFDTSTAALDEYAARAAAPPPAASCGHVDAATIEPAQPPYPPLAMALHAHGTVRVSVALDEHGFVRRVAAIDKATAGDTGGEALLTQTIVYAGASTYKPALENCRDVPGSYIFRADYAVTAS